MRIATIIPASPVPRRSDATAVESASGGATLDFLHCSCAADPWRPILEDGTPESTSGTGLPKHPAKPALEPFDSCRNHPGRCAKRNRPPLTCAQMQALQVERCDWCGKALDLNDPMQRAYRACEGCMYHHALASNGDSI